MNNNLFRYGLLWLSGCWLLGACSWLNSPPTVMEFVPGSLQADTQRHVQQLHIQYADHGIDLLGVLELDSAHTSLAVLNPAGLPMFTISHSTLHWLVEQHPDIPAFVDPRQILADVQLVNWPQQQLQAAVEDNIVLIQSPQQRILRKGERTLVTARFDPHVTAWHKAEISHHQLGYTIQITALERVILKKTNQLPEQQTDLQPDQQSDQVGLQTTRQAITR